MDSWPQYKTLNQNSHCQSLNGIWFSNITAASPLSEKDKTTKKTNQCENEASSVGLSEQFLHMEDG